MVLQSIEERGGHVDKSSVHGEVNGSDGSLGVTSAEKLLVRGY